MELLNIDDLVKPKRAIVVGGYEHVIAEQSIGQLIESIKLAKAVRTEDDPAFEFEQYVKAVQRLLPTCPEATIRGLTMRQLGAIMDFANKPDVEAVAEAAAEKKESEQAPAA